MTPPVTDRQSSLPPGAILSEQGSRLYIPNPEPGPQAVQDELSSAQGDEAPSGGCLDGFFRLCSAVREFFLWLFCCSEGSLSWDVSRDSSRAPSPRNEGQRGLNVEIQGDEVDEDELSDASNSASPKGDKPVTETQIDAVLGSPKVNSSSRGSVSSSPLHDLLFAGQYEELTKSLNAGGDVNERNRNGSTLLQAVCGRANSPARESRTELLALINMLLEKGVDINAEDNWGTALHRACKEFAYDIVELLLRYNPDLEVADPKGRTVLHIACSSANVKLAEMLLVKGASIEARSKGNQRTPLHHLCVATRPKKAAAVEKSPELVILELFAQKEYFAHILNAEDADGNTALKLAKEAKKDDLVKALDVYHAREKAGPRRGSVDRSVGSSEYRKTILLADQLS